MFTTIVLFNAYVNGETVEIPINLDSFSHALPVPALPGRWRIHMVSGANFECQIEDGAKITDHFFVAEMEANSEKAGWLFGAVDDQGGAPNGFAEAIEMGVAAALAKDRSAQFVGT